MYVLYTMPVFFIVSKSFSGDFFVFMRGFLWYDLCAPGKTALGLNTYVSRVGIDVKLQLLLKWLECVEYIE